ncbi:serine hydrolase [Nocardia camponoti]|uniref:Serine hydrolase n=1 Tax=Nocardia camponoti TaxID=1616106 RepID=A0A917Q992_9NOCA|nr:serine hydrolase [Nocardia camponoti]GGK35957.1 serine hydrolase [Nocardia camponoti]
MTTALRTAHRDLRDVGLRGSFLVRDLDTGEEIGFDTETEWPIASLVKIPLALATLERVARSELDPARRLEVQPGRIATPGPAGLTKFRQPVTIALEDLLYLSVAVSDDTAGDVLFGLTPPAMVEAELARMGYGGINIRHSVRPLSETPAERFDQSQGHLAQSLAIEGATDGHGHAVGQLDVSTANTGTACAFIDLAQGLWRPTTITASAAERVRELMGDNVNRQRLTPDFAADATRWASKTGTLLNLRHEVGVIEHPDGQTIAVAAFTSSHVAATIQPSAEAVMAKVARDLHDELRVRAY